ncbi:extracellular solute-binding protein [Solwaraspora sp. WMMD1047]|uniref:extracellular solute-binding protein n=1 Tax=Solwaraspora sp. WMMD1047 TaxID=3016102 RepID=UPI002417D7D1|nr:extracellular solute-binding protein [Solwaraspora sp. WMMD1047]MDG4834512.1 extracellular solute-binding protein [Solwaraspora sp. WMMD1047]
MPDQVSRRAFLSGVLATGAFSAVGIYLVPGGRSLPSVELRLTTGEDSTGARDLLISLWNQAHPRSIIRTEVVASGSGDEWRVMLAKAQNGETDLVNLDIIDVPQFARDGLIDPIPMDGGQLVEPLRTISRVPGSDEAYWAAPFNADVGMLFTRVDDERAEVSFRSLADLYAEIPDGSREFVGQLRSTVSAHHEGFVVNVLEHACSVRPAALNDFAEENAASQADRVYRDEQLWKDALTPLREAIARNRVLAVGSEAETRDEFGRPDATARYMRNWPVKYRELQQLGNPDVRAGRIRVQPLDVGILGGQSLAVVSSSPHVAQAREFVQFATSLGAQRILAAHGLAPTVIGAYSGENLRAPIPHLDAVREAVEKALPRPVHPRYREFSAILRSNVDRFLHAEDDLSSSFITELVETLS